MTALLELKQKIKEIYGQYEMYILPVMKFVLALVYFLWINANMGYMSRLNNVFLVLILALICSIFPSSAMMYIGFVLILVHSYALGIEIAAFMLVLILLMMIFFLRFSGEQNVTFVFTPLSFAFSLPALLPIGSGLMESSLSAIPAGCGVVMYYFIRFLRSQSTILVNPDLEMTDKLQIMADGLVQNWGMWIAVVAFVAVILLVHLIRTRSFDHAWRISIITGGVAYVFIMLVGSFGMNLNATVAMIPLLICGYFLNYMFPIVGSEWGLSETYIGYTYLLNGIFVLILGTPLTEFFSNRGWKHLGLAAAAFIYAAAFLEVAMLQNIPSLLIALALIGVADSFGIPLLTSYFTDLKDVERFGYDRGLGVYSLFENGAQSLGSFVFGYVLVLGVGRGLIFVLILVSVLSAAFLISTTFAAHRDKKEVKEHGKKTKTEC